MITMEQSQFNTKREKGKHLTYEDRVIIQTRLKDRWSPYRIAKELGCASNTVRNEIKRGTVTLYNGKCVRYKASVGQARYEENRSNSKKSYSRLEKAKFIKYVEAHFQEDGWSLDASCGRALATGEFKKEDTVCTKTLYNYVDLGMMPIKNIDLPLKLRRSTKAKKVRKNKKILGRSIEERPMGIDNREEFGHWEADLVIGQKSGKDQVLLTLIERKSRELLIFKIANRTARAVMDEFERLQNEYGEMFSRIFKTITTDNGSEFANLNEIEKFSNTLVYYAHPYSSWEKGTNERHNGLIRRFIPKGKRIDNYSIDDVIEIEDWCNQLPRKLLGYMTPDEIFNDELDKIYAA